MYVSGYVRNVPFSPAFLQSTLAFTLLAAHVITPQIVLALEFQCFLY